VALGDRFDAHDPADERPVRTQLGHAACKRNETIRFIFLRIGARYVGTVLRFRPRG
jgi:hypothetical protein